ncbi:DUF2382 domain-containing protein [Leptolyngbya sp. AN03gr2]|uniref:DUF2382 domain-containing protein n=1 Tax=unclassified Leptolyngbya TaxID=2650499 RepID=UPI003D31E5A4
MALMKFDELYSNYRDTSDSSFDIDNLKQFSVYADGNDKVGSVSDILVDTADGRIRYFVVDTGFWVFGKRVLLPVGLSSIDYDDKRIYANTMTKQQVEDLPNFDELDKVDYNYEEQVRNVYRPAGVASISNQPARTQDNYRYEQDADLYDLSDRNHQGLKLYEERLLADKKRQKTGEVSIGKHVETVTARATVPVEKERVVIERSAPTQASAVNANEAFHDQQVAHVDLYEETPDIRKEAFVREEVRVRKEVEQDTVTTEETIRREELDINTQGRPTVER